MHVIARSVLALCALVLAVHGLNSDMEMPPVSHVNVTNCGSKSDLIKVHTFTLTPNPITAGRKFDLALDVEILEELDGFLSINSEFYKFVFIWWFKLPCVDGLGSCSVSDLCSIIETACPKCLVCPVKKNRLSFDKLSFTLPDLHMAPDILVDGKYKMELQMSQDHKQIFCTRIEFYFQKLLI